MCENCLNDMKISEFSAEIHCKLQFHYDNDINAAQVHKNVCCL